MQTNHKQCLLLNADYTPLSIISWQKAIIWSMRFSENAKYSIEIIDFYKNDYINGVDKKYPIPAIAKTHRFFKINHQIVTFSRKNIFIRDDYTCQYCNQKYDINNLTYDHVIPKSKWRDNRSAATCWTNIVTACTWCNRRKGNKTPKEANMPLKNLPTKPNKNVKYLPINDLLNKIRKEIPDEWMTYLPQSFNY
jgi:hypothetical protein